MKVFVFLNGGLSKPRYYRSHFEKFFERGDVVYCANGGSRVAIKAGIIPDFIIGDLDSFKNERGVKRSRETEKIIYPPDKDFSDFELILNRLKESGVDEVFVYGALGGRIDHELINVLLLTHSDLKMSFIESSCEIYNVVNERRIMNMSGRICSIFTLSGCYVEEMSGFKYILEDYRLLPSSKGLSNVILSDTARIKIKDGKLCVVVIRETT